ncbi:MULTISPECIES: AI-2E family transporter [unclassified Haladaptatus]|uniref:AI-2E family transporter n=1 Tax=unclassified Haladaptatus TaxID=2622732 RepID=UPI00209BBC84|nr:MULTISPECIES: AI-2E family transporter [unclassified Haladaptatus]MCO8245800.1 AI-2E family transporter [Haladaptatus sp. AB643]MCO8256147.1 AI-2E family transporter [Haladaptatus sp. AB618]
MADDTALPMERSRLAWWVVGVVLAIIVLFVFYSFEGTFVLGLFMYYATRPIYNRLEHRLGHPGLTAFASLIAVALPVVVLISYAVAVSAVEVASIAGESLKGYEGVLRPYFDLSSLTVHPQRIIHLLQQSQGEIMRLGGPELLKTAVDVAAAFGTALLQLFVALAFAFYLLRDDDKLVRWFVRDIGGERSTAYSYLAAVDRSLQTVYFGNILNAFVVGLAAAVVYNLANVFAPPGLAVPLPTLLGLLTGIASLVPIVGVKLIYVPIAAYLLVKSLDTGIRTIWFPVAFVALFIIVIDLVAETVIRPYITGRELHVGLMLFAYIFGPLLFGWYGLFFGPLLLVLLIQFNRVVLPDLIQGEPLPKRHATGKPAESREPRTDESETKSDDEVESDDEAESDGKTESGNGTEDDATNLPDESHRDEDDTTSPT